MRKSLSDRFWEKVNKTPECWEWTAALVGGGYGHFKVDGAMKLAHRVSYEMARGTIGEGLVLDHLCRNRACVNPAHLEPVTSRVNILRGIGYTAEQAKKTSCAQGHPFTPANTYVWRNQRHCRSCKRERDRARRERL